VSSLAPLAAGRSSHGTYSTCSYDAVQRARAHQTVTAPECVLRNELRHPSMVPSLSTAMTSIRTGHEHERAQIPSSSYETTGEFMRMLSQHDEETPGTTGPQTWRLRYAVISNSGSSNQLGSTANPLPGAVGTATVPSGSCAALRRQGARSTQRTMSLPAAFRARVVAASWMF
jgi:hypothetical protein